MIDIKKTYKTRTGVDVRIYATDGGGEYPVHGAINYDGEWFPRHWTAEGVTFSDNEQSRDDLIEVKPRIQHDEGKIDDTREEAADEITRRRADNIHLHIKNIHLRVEVKRLRAALDLYREAVRIDVTMEGPKFMGSSVSALKRAWDADRARARAALEEK